MSSTINASTSAGIVQTADTSGVLQLQTANTAAVTIDASQNVGIGTSSPAALLHTYTAVQESVRFCRNSTNSSAYVTFYANNSSSAQVQYAGILGDVASSTAGSHGGNLLFYTTGSGTSAERMRIDSSGNVLVGRTSNLGASRFVVEADTTSTNPMTVSNSRSTAATDYSILFYRNASLVGSVQTTLTATSYVTSSDYRLKDNVQPMTGALEKVAQLNPVTYTWKADGSDGQGFIAHELQAVVPDCVTGEKDAVDADGNPVYQGIDTSFLVATLTKAIQELSAKNDALEARLAKLEAK